MGSQACGQPSDYRNEELALQPIAFGPLQITREQIDQLMGTPLDAIELRRYISTFAPMHDAALGELPFSIATHPDAQTSL